MPRTASRLAAVRTTLILASRYSWPEALRRDRDCRSPIVRAPGLEGRWYYQDGDHPGQESHAGGFVVEPKFYVEDAEGRSLTVAPFFRYDAADPRRTHVDVREAYLLLLGEIGEGEWELRLGADRVFWGVTESRHLVDIVNQTDVIEHPNEEAKLGQPMAHLTWSGDAGVVELFALPYHRERTFPGPVRPAA